MRVDRSYCSNQNTWSENHPQCIVVHNTDNFAAGADARAHARAQYQGNFQIMSAHYYVDDGEIAYQAAPHSRGCWHVGRNYGSKNLFGRYGNRNSIAVEMCVQKGYDYETAFLHTVELVKNLMNETGIPFLFIFRLLRRLFLVFVQLLQNGRFFLRLFPFLGFYRFCRIKLNTFAITCFTTIGNGMSSFTAQNIGANKPGDRHYRTGQDHQ